MIGQKITVTLKVLVRCGCDLQNRNILTLTQFVKIMINTSDTDASESDDTAERVTSNTVQRHPNTETVQSRDASDTDTVEEVNDSSDTDTANTDEGATVGLRLWQLIDIKS